MRLVIDTGVLVSYLLADESPLARTVDQMMRSHTALYSAETFAEIVEVLRRPKIARYIDAGRADATLLYLRGLGEMVDITETIVACRDPRDDKFLSLAVSGRADCIVSGDADLLVLHPFRGIPILKVADFPGQFGP
jgi:putative PIN family toxin of toxin-antitoxin system